MCKDTKAWRAVAVGESRFLAWCMKAFLPAKSVPAFFPFITRCSNLKCQNGLEELADVLHICGK